MSGLKSVFRLAKPMNFSKNYQIQTSNDWDEYTQNIKFYPEGFVCITTFSANHDWASEKTEMGIYLVRPNNKVLLITFPTKDNHRHEINNVLPDIQEIDGSLEGDEIKFNYSNKG